MVPASICDCPKAAAAAASGESMAIKVLLNILFRVSLKARAFQHLLAFRDFYRPRAKNKNFLIYGQYKNRRETVQNRFQAKP